MAGLRYPSQSSYCRVATAMNLLLGVFQVLLPGFRLGGAQGQGKNTRGGCRRSAAGGEGGAAGACVCGGVVDQKRSGSDKGESGLRFSTLAPLSLRLSLCSKDWLLPSRAPRKGGGEEPRPSSPSCLVA